jgi:hypothetical protein
MMTSSAAIPEVFRSWQGAFALCFASMIGCGQETNGRSGDNFAVPRSSGDSVSQQQATGSGHHTVGGALRTFTFNGIRHSDGTVSGEAELFNRRTGFLAHAEIICMTVIGNKAWLGGIIKHSPGGFCDDTNMYFNVQDNGEGPQRQTDLLSAAGVCDVEGAAAVALVTAYCDSAGATDPALPVFPIEDGNIQVHD